MEKIYVYLGSDHVIQHPSFGLREKRLNLSTSRKEAIHQACSKDAAGVLNTYTLDLDALCVKAPNQEVMSGFESFDIELLKDGYISICSKAALEALEFASASFVNQ